MAGVQVGVMSEIEFRRPEVAEELGFDSIWAGEHIAAPFPIYDGIPILSYYAARTSRIAVGSGILLLPLRPPVALAKSITTLDRLSDGRFICGIGVGGEFPKEFEACGVPVRERGARTDEAIEIFRKLWGPDEQVSHQGRFWQFEDVPHIPKPIQAGGPPIWVSGRSDAAIERTARVGNGYLPYLMTADRYRRSVEKLRAACERRGRDPGEITLGCLIDASIDSDSGRALQTVRERLTRTYGPNLWDLAEHLTVWGTPEDAAERVAAFADAGCQHFVLSIRAPEASALEDKLRLTAELIPHLK